MKKFLFILLALCVTGASVFAQSTSLELTGFRITASTTESVSLRFQDQYAFVISKQFFSSQKQAAAFCKSQKSALDTEFSALLIAMSGAANVNVFLKKAIVFDLQIQKVSGIWQWAPIGEKVTMMYDGRGSDYEMVAVSDMKKVLKTIQIPAICSQKLK